MAINDKPLIIYVFCKGYTTKNLWYLYVLLEIYDANLQASFHSNEYSEIIVYALLWYRKSIVK